MYREVFPERIKKARLDTGFTQDEVAKETKIARSNIGKYETGKLEPDIEKLAILAEFYNISVDWLIGVGSKRPNETPIKNIDQHKHQRQAKDAI